jgi:hypothetical protein
MGVLMGGDFSVRACISTCIVEISYILVSILFLGLFLRAYMECSRENGEKEEEEDQK